jgi:mannosyltransferase OCH1-like enzyme
MKIPNNIIVTWKDSNIPEYVFSNLKKLNPDKEILFFTDEDVVKFLSAEYDSSYVDFFHGIKRGCNKGDFFRYCYLYKRGGYYSDIDIRHREPIKNYISSDIDFFSVLAGIADTHMFQALLYCISDHPVIEKCIKDIMSSRAQRDTHLNTPEDMYKNVSKFIGRKNLVPGTTTRLLDGQNIRLAQEVKLDDEYACVYRNTIIAMSRYVKYNRIEGFMEWDQK